MKKKYTIIIMFVTAVIFISYRLYLFLIYEPDTIMVTSISSDGHYAITSGTDKRITLWDLKNHKAKIISDDANIYSAYFIKNSDKFIWQDLKQDEVYVEDIHGNIIQHFKPGFPSYGEVMTTNLHYYIASNDNWDLFMMYDGQVHKMMGEDEGGFVGAGKLINLIFTSDDHYLLTAGIGTGYPHAPVMKEEENIAFDDITLWDYKILKPIRQYIGNEAKEVAAISPEDQYIVGGDEQPLGFVWDLKTGNKLFDLDDVQWGHPINRNVENWEWSQKGLTPQPKDYGYCFGFPKSYKEKINGSIILALKFIDHNHYLRFTYDTPWALLYAVKNPQPSKYFYLGENPPPSLDDFTRNESIDTSPSAHILVTGQYNADGIIEYQYDPKTQTLSRVWAPNAPSFFAKWFWVSK